MSKPARWIAILASFLIACVAQAATTTKPPIHRRHAHMRTRSRGPQHRVPNTQGLRGRVDNARRSGGVASYRTVRYARQSNSAASHASGKKSRRAVRHHYSRRHYHHHVRLPKGPTSERITEIQSALARGGYYKGDPSGKWDSGTVAALQKFQSANNIDASGKLDAPTLQKLGLGSDIAGVAAPRPVVPAACCSAANVAPAPAVTAKPADAANSVPAAAHAQPVATSANSSQTSAAGAGASSTASVAPAAATSAAAASGPAAASKPTAAPH